MLGDTCKYLRLDTSGDIFIIHVQLPASWFVLEHAFILENLGKGQEMLDLVIWVTVIG
jgi:hypothetical protein